ncbi:endolysin [Acinetobacter virus vB_AbaP_AGC01]|uniref:Endolysin n=1 Tax=Acinetobacter virus vB_AbaP_AGC01 TaxID=2723754 RepID=A0A6H0X2I6_9CAUD|nr:endolysin [Acinetobacter virus vB_AbaP_AGC01]
MNILRSFTETVVTTPTELFPISFEYDEKYDAVHVFLNDVAVEDLGYTVSQVNAVTLKVEPAITEGTVRIERETDIDKMKYIFDAGALFIDQNVDADFRQIVHSQQEVRDGFIKLRGDVLPLVHGLQEALQQAQEASEAAQEAAAAAEEAAQQTRMAEKVIDKSGLTQQQINDAWLTVENFGAKGDGVTDDSAAFQAYCDSPFTGANIRLANRRAVYIIKKQVDCKGKGIVGNGFGKQSQAAYDLSSIRVMEGDYTNSNADLADIAFINVGAEVRNLQFVSSNLGTISGINVSGYNTTINNVNFTGFKNQVHVVGASVRFSVSDLTSIGAANAGFYFRDKQSDQSTTAYFNQCSWQWGNKAVVFAKEAYGCVFRDNIVEYMDGGFEASVFSNCIFEGNWCESTRSGNAIDWIVNTSYQQLFSCKFGINYIRAPWIDRTNPNDIAGSNNAGGIQAKNSAVAVTGATGAKVRLSPTGLDTRFASYFGTSNNPLSTRALLLTTQDRDASSNYTTPIVIAPPNGALWYRNYSATDYTPVISRHLIGANADNTAAYYGVDTYTKRVRKWSTFEHTTNTSGQFLAPIMLTYDSTATTQQVNAGWSITKEAGTTGVYILQRTANTVSPMTSPNIICGGFHMGSRVGTGAFVTYSLQAIETYGGSWSTYLEGAGVKIFCRDQTGALVNVNRFTAMFTVVSGF